MISFSGCQYQPPSNQYIHQTHKNSCAADIFSTFGEVMIFQRDTVNGCFNGGVDQFDYQYQKYAGDHEYFADMCGW